MSGCRSPWRSPVRVATTCSVLPLCERGKAASVGRPLVWRPSKEALVPTNSKRSTEAGHVNTLGSPRTQKGKGARLGCFIGLLQAPSNFHYARGVTTSWLAIIRDLCGGGFLDSTFHFLKVYGSVNSWMTPSHNPTG